jgi:hypothetical protein
MSYTFQEYSDAEINRMDLPALAALLQRANEVVNPGSLTTSLICALGNLLRLIHGARQGSVTVPVAVVRP